MLVPIFLLVSAVPISAATPLSVTAIAGGAVANFVAYSRRRRPSGQPLIDYGAALLMLPALLAGSMWGTLLDKVLPEPLLVAGLLVLLSGTTVRTARRGLAAWRAGESGEGREGGGREVSRLGSQSSQRPPLFPSAALSFSALAWLVVLAASLARGGHGAPSLLPGGVACGSLHYWSLLLLAQAALAALALAVRGRLEGAPEAGGGTALLAGSFSAGLAAGTLGIGGGTLVAPLLLELGCEPRAVAATSAFLVLLADTSVAAQFAVLGMLPPSHGASLAATAFVATAVGQAASERLIAASGRSAVVTLLVAATVGASAVATGAVALSALGRRVDEGGAASALAMRSLCGPH